MASHVKSQACDMADAGELHLVRSFTGSLEGRTPLEVGTRAAQIQFDGDIEQRNQMRLRRHYDDARGDPT